MWSRRQLLKVSGSAALAAAFRDDGEARVRAASEAVQRQPADAVAANEDYWREIQSADWRCTASLAARTRASPSSRNAAASAAEPETLSNWRRDNMAELLCLTGFPSVFRFSEAEAG